jgi:hypothetical protein
MPKPAHHDVSAQMAVDGGRMDSGVPGVLVRMKVSGTGT